MRLRAHQEKREAADMGSGHKMHGQGMSEKGLKKEAPSLFRI